MPLPKSATKKERSDARLQRYHTRKKAEQYYGKKAVRGKAIHHRTGNKNNNKKWNLKTIDPRNHGKRHGRGNKGSITKDAWRKFKGVMLSKETI